MENVPIISLSWISRSWSKTKLYDSMCLIGWCACRYDAHNYIFSCHSGASKPITVVSSTRICTHCELPWQEQQDGRHDPFICRVPPEPTDLRTAASLAWAIILLLLRQGILRWLGYPEVDQEHLVGASHLTWTTYSIIELTTAGDSSPHSTVWTLGVVMLAML